MNHIGFARQNRSATRQSNSDKPAARDAALLVPGSKFIRHYARRYVHENRFQMQGDDCLRSRITTSNASLRFFPKVTMPPSCPAMTKISLLRTSLTVNRRMISYAMSGVPYAMAFEVVGTRSRRVRHKTES